MEIDVLGFLQLSYIYNWLNKNSVLSCKWETKEWNLKFLNDIDGIERIDDINIEEYKLINGFSDIMGIRVELYRKMRKNEDNRKIMKDKKRKYKNLIIAFRYPIKPHYYKDKDYKTFYYRTDGIINIYGDDF